MNMGQRKLILVGANLMGAFVFAALALTVFAGDPTMRTIFLGAAALEVVVAGVVLFTSR